MYKFLQNNKGMVTILLSLILIPIMSLSSLMMEIGRAVSAKELVKEAEKSSIMSLMACYEKTLLEDYGITGVHYTSNEDLNRQFLEYMNFNSDNEGSDSTAFGKVYKIENAEVAGIYNLANYSVMMHSLIECGKYTEAYAIADEFLNFSAFLDKLAGMLGFDKVQNFLDAFTGALDKVANVADMINKLNDLKDDSQALITEISTLADKINSVGVALADKKAFVDENGDSGAAPSRPDATANNETYEYKRILSQINRCREDELDNEIDLVLQGLMSLISPTKSDGSIKTNREVLEELYPKLISYSITVPSSNSWTKSDVSAASISAEARYNSIHRTYSNQLNKYNDYYNGIGEKNQAITDACVNVANEVDNVNSKLNVYKDQIGLTLEAVKQVATDMGRIKSDMENADDDFTASESNSKSEVGGVIDKLNAKATSSIETIQGALTRIKTVFGGISGESAVQTIKNTISGSVSYLNWSDIKNSVKNYLVQWLLNKDEIAVLILSLEDTRNWLGELLDFVKAVKAVLNIIKPWPDLSDSQYDTVMSENNMAITLKRTDSNGINSDVMEKMLGDVTTINNRIATGNQVAQEYGISTLNNVPTPTETTENETSIIDSFLEFGGSVKKLMSDLLGTDSDFGVISVICNLISGQLLADFKDVFNKFVNLISSLFDIVKNLINKAYNNIMLTEYARLHFNNRLSENTVGYDGDGTYQLFKNAEQEYIIIGNKSEKTNQVSVGTVIFIYRLLINVIAVLMDAEAMSIISACNVFGPLVYIAWVYLESCIDVNCIVSNIGVGIVKEHLWISVDSISDIAENCDDLEADDSPEEMVRKLLGGVTGDDFGYDEYMMFFMLLTTNKTKSMRIGDLIQWHVRNKTKKDFLLENTYCMFRAEAKVSLNPMLPIINISNSSAVGLSNRTTFSQVAYEGY